MRFLDLSPDHMRQPAFPGQKVLGDRGENLPTVLKDMCADPERKRTLTDWTRELTPMDVVDFEFPTDPTTGRIQLALRERNGRVVSSYAASDGTLRMLAMLAALRSARAAAGRRRRSGQRAHAVGRGGRPQRSRFARSAGRTSTISLKESNDTHAALDVPP